MQTSTLSTWWLRLSTFALAALAAACAAFWALKWTTPSVTRPETLIASSNFTASDPLAVARLLGGGQSATPATPNAADSSAKRLSLTGVVADQAIGGYALISVDGKPAQPFRIGAKVTETLMLQSLALRSAALSASTDTPASVTLDLPKINN